MLGWFFVNILEVIPVLGKAGIGEIRNRSSEFELKVELKSSVVLQWQQRLLVGAGPRCKWLALQSSARERERV